MSDRRHRYKPWSERRRKIVDEVDQHLYEAVWLWQKYINRPYDEHYDEAWDEFADRLHDQWDVVWNMEAPE